MLKIFVSYAHADSRWLNELRPHLEGLKHYANVQSFYDTQLLGGDGWSDEIKQALDQADIVLLLVTPNFIGSEYIHRVELPAALKKRQEKGCVVIPILVESCARRLLGIDDINYLPKDDQGRLKPLDNWRGTKRAEALSIVIEHVLQQIEMKQAKVTEDEAQIKETGIDLAVYRERAKTKWLAIDLFTLTAPGAIDADAVIPLASVFVPPLARPSRPRVSLPRDYLRAQGLDPETVEGQAAQLAWQWESQTPEPALALVAKSKHLLQVLLGDPGAGKSALVRYTLLQLLTGAPTTDSPLQALRGHVPFLIELRDYVARERERRCSNLLGYLAYCGSELGFGFDADALDHQLRHKPSLLMIDGLDEIFDPKRRRLMVDEIIGLIGRYPKLRLLVTSRIAGFDDTPFLAAGFRVATLVDLTPEQVQQFAEVWFTLIFPSDPDVAARARDDLLETLKRRPQLAAIAGNPMILTIMATVARHKRLGRSRAALYAQALELLCYTWDYRKGLDLPSDSPLTDLQAEDTLEMLFRIAWRMQQASDGVRANAIAEADLRAALEEFFLHDWRFDPPRSRRAAHEMLERLQIRNWVLTVRGPALYGFVHRTFLEYLCALELLERFKAQQLSIEALIANHVVARLDDDAWQEVVRLLIGSLPPPAAEQVLLAIVPSEAEVVVAQRHFALAWQGLAEVEPRHIPTMVTICTKLTDLLYAWLAGGADGTVLREAGARIIDAVNSIGRIEWPVSHPPARSWPNISQCGSTEVNVIRALADTIWHCSEQALVDFFRILSENITDPGAFEWAISFLRSHGTDKQQMGNLLRRWVVNAPHKYTRFFAVVALAEHLGDDPQSRDLLRKRTREEPEEHPRRKAVSILSRIIDVPHAVVLASQDLDGAIPGRDPREPISAEVVSKAAKKLGESEKVIEDLYKRLAKELSLTLAFD